MMLTVFKRKDGSYGWCIACLGAIILGGMMALISPHDRYRDAQRIHLRHRDPGRL
jgi:hypothetical protein